jgi:hypothetical protein
MDNKHREFKTCPVCSSSKRLFETLAQAGRDKGTVNKEAKMAFGGARGSVFDQARASMILVGSTAPVYDVKTDICMECGCVYATDFTIGEGKVLPVGKADNLPPPPTKP